MKRMNHYLLTAAAVLCLGMGVASCSDEASSDEDIEGLRGYWVGDHLIELWRTGSNLYYLTLRNAPDDFVYTQESSEAIFGGEGREVVSFSSRGAFVLADRRPEIEGVYVSEEYASDQFTLHLVPLISLCLTEGHDIDVLTRKYDVLSLSGTVNQIYRLRCDVATSEELLDCVARLHAEPGVEWVEPTTIGGFRLD